MPFVHQRYTLLIRTAPMGLVDSYGGGGGGGAVIVEGPDQDGGGALADGGCEASPPPCQTCGSALALGCCATTAAANGAPRGGADAGTIERADGNSGAFVHTITLPSGALN
jgi:hypothetical protein